MDEWSEELFCGSWWVSGTMNSLCWRYIQLLITMQQVLVGFRLNCPQTLSKDGVSILELFSSGSQAGLVSEQKSEAYWSGHPGVLQPCLSVASGDNWPLLWLDWPWNNLLPWENSLPVAGAWDELVFKAPSCPNHSVILWRCEIPPICVPLRWKQMYNWMWFFCGCRWILNGLQLWWLLNIRLSWGEIQHSVEAWGQNPQFRGCFETGQCNSHWFSVRYSFLRHHNHLGKYFSMDMGSHWGRRCEASPWWCQGGSGEFKIVCSCT